MYNNLTKSWIELSMPKPNSIFPSTQHKYLNGERFTFIHRQILCLCALQLYISYTNYTQLCEFIIQQKVKKWWKLNKIATEIGSENIRSFGGNQSNWRKKTVSTSNGSEQLTNGQLFTFEPINKAAILFEPTMQYVDCSRITTVCIRFNGTCNCIRIKVDRCCHCSSWCWTAYFFQSSFGWCNRYLIRRTHKERTKK